MKAAGLVLALALGLAAFGPADKAEAKTYLSFGFYGPGFYGPGYYGYGYGYPYHHRRYYGYGYYGPRSYYGPRYYYGPSYYPSRYYGPRYYRPHRYRRGGSCGYWSQRCGGNWGYNNPNYYGCMRYEGC